MNGVATLTVAEVFRFDVTKEWVYQRWDRKSTALAELDLFGVRVPLVTGTQLYDVAGSLTYFFGADGRVKRISFRGQTGDTTELVRLATQRFGLQARPSAVAGEQLFQLHDGDKLISELRTQTAPVLWSASPHNSFRVELELQDPAAARPLTSSVLAALPQPPAAPLASTPSAAAAPAHAAGVTASPDHSTAGTPPASPEPPSGENRGWKALFPRSQLPKSQLQLLNQGNLYQW
ncbi:MAG: hypothetical protein DCC67_11365 [Planctomycetota bacterium]|nr:MAG: hypothetical protein DCC67_11365 [Planctomycetota bacterium]